MKCEWHLQLPRLRRETELQYNERRHILLYVQWLRNF